MMKKSIFIIFVIMISGIIISLSPFREFWCKQWWIGDMRNVVEFFCPPEDLYFPVFKEEINISQKNYIKEFVFKIKYIGPYHIGIYIDKNYDELFGDKYKFNLVLKIAFFHNKKQIYSISTNSNYSLLSRGKIEGFAVLNSFRVPKRLPRGKEIMCRVTVFTEDKDFYNKFGPVKIGMERWTDL